MFNSKLKQRIKELEKENEVLKLGLKNVNIIMPESVKDRSYGNLVKRIIEHAKYSEYSPYQTKLLSFIVNELTIIRDIIL